MFFRNFKEATLSLKETLVDEMSEKYYEHRVFFSTQNTSLLLLNLPEGKIFKTRIQVSTSSCLSVLRSLRKSSRFLGQEPSELQTMETTINSQNDNSSRVSFIAISKVSP